MLCALTDHAIERRIGAFLEHPWNHSNVESGLGTHYHLEDVMEADTKRGWELLGHAREEYRSGSVRSSWETARVVAAIARKAGDGELLADAALVVNEPIIGAWDLAAQRHSLCLEALDLIGDRDPVRAERLRTLVAVTQSPWHSHPGNPLRALDPADADKRARELHARHAAAIGAAGVQARLDIANDLMELADATRREEDAAWALLWRLDACAQLGLRVELNAELMRLSSHAVMLSSPAWEWRVAAARASMALLDGHLDDVPVLAAAALRCGTAAGLEEATFVDLVLRARFAVQTQTGLHDIEPEVRRVLSGAPFFAHGWHAEILLASGRTDEAAAIWRALAPRLPDFPTNSIEWLVAMAGYADLCASLGDTVTAPYLVERLVPYADQHAWGGIVGPYEGPVALFLGRLTALLGDHTAARSHFTLAVEQADRVHAPYFGDAARRELRDLQQRGHPLTLREYDVARLVTDGLTNRQIAARLVLSERTVENHVSNILRKLGLSTRTAIAARMRVDAKPSP